MIALRVAACGLLVFVSLIPCPAAAQQDYASLIEKAVHSASQGIGLKIRKLCEENLEDKSRILVVFNDNNNLNRSEQFVFEILRRQTLDTLEEAAYSTSVFDTARSAGFKGPRINTANVKSLQSIDLQGENDAILSATYSVRSGKRAIKYLLINDKQESFSEIAKLKAAPFKKIPAVPRSNQLVVTFCERMLGKTVGNGECWTLANEVLKVSKAHTPRPPDNYVFGQELQTVAAALPGDIMQFRAAKIGGATYGVPGQFDSQHTAIIRQVLGDGRFEIMHQNWGAAGKTVSITTLDLNLLDSGKVTIYRPVQKSR